MDSIFVAYQRCTLTLTSFFFLFIFDQMLCEQSDVFASACAIARAFPLFTRRSTSSTTEKKRVTVEFVVIGQDNTQLDSSILEVIPNNYHVQQCTNLLNFLIYLNMLYVAGPTTHFA